MPQASFIGIDLAWLSNKNPSGGAVLVGDRDGAELSAIDGLLPSLAAVSAFIHTNERAECIVAIDAPLVIPNDTGQRACETLIGREYGARHASCHTSNRARYPESASVALALALGQRGYVHAPDGGTSRIMMEVYPHPALIEMFNLPTILRYKKGSSAMRASGLETLQGFIASLAEATPPLRANDLLGDLLSMNPRVLAGATRKALEDQLDAVICSYIAFHFWYWKWERTRCFGTSQSGYIVVPSGKQAASARASV